MAPPFTLENLFIIQPSACPCFRLLYFQALLVFIYLCNEPVFSSLGAELFRVAFARGRQFR